MGFFSRFPTSNDPRDDVLDTTAMLLCGVAKRCHACKRAFPEGLLVKEGRHFFCVECSEKLKKGE